MESTQINEKLLSLIWGRHSLAEAVQPPAPAWPRRHSWAHSFLSVSCCVLPSLACDVLLATSSSVPSLFCPLCLTASSPKPLPPPGSSSLSCLGHAGDRRPSSPWTPWPASGAGPDSSSKVSLLPPFLSDQAQHVQALGTFHLFCQATGELGPLCPLCPVHLSPPTGGGQAGASSTSLHVCSFAFFICPGCVPWVEPFHAFIVGPSRGKV